MIDLIDDALVALVTVRGDGLTASRWPATTRGRRFDGLRVDTVYIRVDTVYMELSDASRVLAGILLLSLVTVESGGALMFRVVTGRQEATPLQQSFFRAGHAHAGVFLVLALVTQILVDATTLTGAAEWVARSFVPGRRPAAARRVLPVGRRAGAPPSPTGWCCSSAASAAVGLLAIGLRHRCGIGLLTGMSLSPRAPAAGGPRGRRRRRPRGPHAAGDRPAGRGLARRPAAPLPQLAVAARRRRPPRASRRLIDHHRRRAWPPPTGRGRRAAAPPSRPAGSGWRSPARPTSASRSPTPACSR